MYLSIGEDYAASLKELTFNLRPIIETLTTIAKENKQDAQGIVEAISNRVYKCIPEQKLFAMYLLDSICKTVGSPYRGLFSAEIFKLFSHVYLLVGDSTRSRLVKMFDLWRTTKVEGESIFDDGEMTKIGQFLSQAGRSEPPSLSPSSLVSNIDALLPVLQRKAATDASYPPKIAALGELRILLQSQQLNPHDLAGIRDKLVSMKEQELLTPSPLAPTTPKTPLSQISTPAPTPMAEPAKAELLFANLIALGMVKMDQSLKPGSKPEYELVLPRVKYTPGAGGAPSMTSLEQLLVEANVGTKSQYEQIKFKELVKVSRSLSGSGENNTDLAASLQKFISKPSLDLATVQLLYETKSLKCSQCGKRFDSDDRGATRKRAHLDWHFRINKKMANLKNVQSRLWYLDLLEWVHFREDALLEFGDTTKKETPPSNAGTTVAKATYVVIPADETNMDNICIICREEVKPTFSSKIDEWIWDNCVYASGTKSGRKIVHLTCLLETSRKHSAEDQLNGRVKRERV